MPLALTGTIEGVDGVGLLMPMRDKIERIGFALVDYFTTTECRELLDSINDRKKKDSK